MYSGCHCSSRPRASSALAELDRLDEPLAARDDLERPVALLVELHRVRDRPRLADEIARLAAAARRSSCALSTADRFGELIVAPAARAATSVDSQPGAAPPDLLNAPFGWIIARTGSDSSRHQVTSVTSPNVQIIAMPLPFSGSASACALTGTSTPNSGVIDRPAEQRLVPLVIRVRDQRDARRNQLRRVVSISTLGRGGCATVD